MALRSPFNVAVHAVAIWGTQYEYCPVGRWLYRCFLLPGYGLFELHVVAPGELTLFQRSAFEADLSTGAISPNGPVKAHAVLTRLTQILLNLRSTDIFTRYTV